MDASVRSAAASYCEQRRAFYIADPPANWADAPTAEAGTGIHWHEEQECDRILSTNTSIGSV